MKKTFEDVVCYVEKDEPERPFRGSWTIELYDGSRWWIYSVKGWVTLRSISEDGYGDSVGMDGDVADESKMEQIFIELLHRHPDARLYEGDDDVMRLVTSVRSVIGSIHTDMPDVHKKLDEVRRNLKAFDGRWES